MPDPNQKSDEKDERIAIALKVPAADPPKLPENDEGVPEKRK